MPTLTSQKKMNPKLKEIINKVGNENSKKILFDYYEANQEMVKEFINTRIDLERGDNILENVTLGLMPRDVKIGIYLSNLAKTPDGPRVLMDQFVSENEESVIAFIRNHPLCPPDAF